MREPAEAAPTPPRRLSDAIREVRDAAADRADVVVELREAQRTRLELLARELAPVFSDVPEDVDVFDFAISSGTQPRLWIDAVSHVTMGRDRRTYRFLRDTRLGRVVLAESPDIKPVADQVTRYVAERMVERQRLIEGDVEPVLMPPARGAEAREAAKAPAGRGSRRLLSALAYVLLGAVIGTLAVLLLAWSDLPELGRRLFG